MKLILLIFAISIYLFTSNTIDGNDSLNNLSKPEEGYSNDEDEEQAKKKITFQEHFRTELQKNNSGDLGREKFHRKFQVFTDMVQTLASEFGADIIFPQAIVINAKKVSKVEVSIPVSGLSGEYVENIKGKFKSSDLKTDAMEYQLLFKVCLPEKNKPYVDVHCPKDKCEESYQIHNDKEKCENVPVMAHDKDSEDDSYKGVKA